MGEAMNDLFIVIPPKKNGFRKEVRCARTGCDELASSDPAMHTIDGEACCSSFCVFMREEEVEELRRGGE